MKFTAESAAGNVIQSYEPGKLRLRDEVLRSNTIVSQSSIVRDWQLDRVEDASIADFAPVLELEPEIILLGTGGAQRFPSIALMTELLKSGIAIEVMATSAACRTYNVLIGEQRAVVAALLVD